MRSQDDASLREIEVLWGLSGNSNDVGDCGNNDGNERERTVVVVVVVVKGALIILNLNIKSVWLISVCAS